MLYRRMQVKADSQRNDAGDDAHNNDELRSDNHTCSAAQGLADLYGPGLHLDGGRAVWNKGAHGVLEQTKNVEQTLPFAIRGFDFDNGSEWLNWTLIRYLQVRPKPIRVTRSRPYHSDDNAHVEQKNWMWARQLLGYGRLESETLLTPINALYTEAWGPLHNFFMPSLKLVEKWREGSRWVRRHDAAQTAYQRLLAHGDLQRKARRELRDRYESLDPFVLAAQVERRLKPILGAALVP